MGHSCDMEVMDPENKISAQEAEAAFSRGVSHVSIK